VMTWDGGKMTIADRFEGKRLNSPNDLVYHSNGDLYFTDPPYGLPRGENDERRELDFFGVFRVTPEGKISLVTKEMSRPNGIAFSPDEKILYVAQSDSKEAIIRAFDVAEDGSVSGSRVFYDATAEVGKRKGLPDGMAVDKEGNLFATGPGGVLVISPDGTLLGRIDTGEPTANCCFGGEDGSTLFITANKVLCRVKTSTVGLGF
jgi:gluconolactonase